MACRTEMCSIPQNVSYVIPKCLVPLNPLFNYFVLRDPVEDKDRVPSWFQAIFARSLAEVTKSQVRVRVRVRVRGVPLVQDSLQVSSSPGGWRWRGKGRAPPGDCKDGEEIARCLLTTFFLEMNRLARKNSKAGNWTGEQLQQVMSGALLRRVSYQVSLEVFNMTPSFPFHHKSLIAAT